MMGGLMELISCPACSNMVSTLAVSCPKCGFPDPKGAVDRHNAARAAISPWKKYPELLLAGILLGVLAVGVPIAQMVESTFGSRSGNEKAVSIQRPERSALDKMEIAFQGGYSRSQIEPVLSEVMRNLGTPLTETERETAADVLVVLRKDSGLQEMLILKCMRGLGPRKVEFSQAAAICATALEAQ